MKKLMFSISLFLGFILFSCEGPKYFAVTVVDKQTKKPIDSVLVKVIVKAGKKEKSAYNLQGYTDSAGKFIRDEMIGYGLSMRKWDFYMEYDKSGYQHKSEVNKTEGTVELEH
ncbi:MAG: hypothetical protein HY951_01470 [Bacteroidia bacterium]|nr:hypothetical protein [Bacteroidia bacterium]